MADETKETKEKKAKKLSKLIEGSTIKITESTTATVITVDIAEFSSEVYDKLAMHGLSQKLGDAAAGKVGKEAVDAINAVYEELKKGEWTTRVPAAEKITKSSILDTYNVMEAGPQKDALKSALIKIGVIKE